MLQNYFFLNRFILELRPLLLNSKIEEIFSQEKSKLVLVTSRDSDINYLEICVVPGNSYLNLRRNYSRAKKNTVNFFNELIGQKIDSIQMAEDDRIVKINASDSNLYFAIRGKYTNVIHIYKKFHVEAFKSIEEQKLQDLQNELLNKKFINDWNSLKIHVPQSEDQIDEIRKKYPFLGSELAKEVKSRIGISEGDKVVNTYYEVLNEIKDSKPCVFINENEQDVHIGYENFKSIPYTERKIFDSTIDAVKFALSKRHYLANKYSKLKIIKNYLEREMNKVSAKINNLQAAIERGSKEELYSKYGNLLLANLNSIKPGMKSITVEDVFRDGDKIEIPINTKISPQQNVENYFNKSKAEKTAFAKTKELFQKTEKNYRSLQKKLELLDNMESLNELEDLMKELKIKSGPDKEKSTDLSDKFKHYVVEGKYKVYVGKDSKNNDLLTTKFAKQNDYWFHARSVSGSHVVLRVENTKEPVPKNILKKVASLAAYHSKAKTAGVVPVAYTFKKYVVKKKGDPVGTVHLLREDVLLVRPEIPNGCEFVTNA